MSTHTARPLVLVSIDGWGLRTDTRGNAISNAKTPTMTRLSQPNATAGSAFCRIDASGFSVGLPDGVMGNSEVGHLTMGAGRVSFQDLVRINKTVSENGLVTNTTLVNAFERAKKNNTRVHFLGLVSDGGVHSHIEHLKALLRAASELKVPSSYVHFFADGRDTPPTSAPAYIEDLQSYMTSNSYGKIATVVGRYYAMDRDKRWERVKVAYEMLTGKVGEKIDGPSKLIETVRNRHSQGENDEFLQPIIVDEGGCIKDGDSVIFIDFRSDRMREISSVFANFHETTTPNISALPFETPFIPSNLHVVQMTQYDEKIKLPIVFPPQTMTNGLSEWISKLQLRQFHTAETEKYAHVTFFFNGGREEAFDREDRALVPSPKVPTYDLQPEMSQAAVADSVIQSIRSKQYQFIMCNFAAPDMVGHTGKYEPAVKACEVCDTCIGRIEEACKENGYILVVTADHGNAEEMEDDDGNPKTSHTTNLIPLIVTNAPSNVSLTTEAQAKPEDVSHPVGGLSDVAPTCLVLMGLPIPAEMTGKSLVNPL